jgi:hypothetical protein
MTTSTLTHLKINLSLPLDDRTTESDYLSHQRLESQMQFLRSIHTEIADKLTNLRSQYQDNN